MYIFNIAIGLISQDAEVTVESARFQNDCMHKVLGLGKNDEENFQYLRENGRCDEETTLEASQDSCNWRGVTCHDKIVTIISWRSLANFVSSIKWIPSSVKYMTMISMNLDGFVETRHLPKNLRECDLSSNNLCGSVELRTLPALIEKLHLENNSFSGIIRLTNLPKSFEKLDLGDNPIKMVIVKKESLPHAFKSARFYDHKRKVKILSIDGPNVDDRVFVSMYPDFSFELSESLELYSDDGIIESHYIA